MKRITVIIPTAKCRAFLPRAIESILNQTYPHFDLYVIDDGRGDVDEERIAAYPSVNFLRMETSGGPYVIDNMMLKETDSPLVAFQDADDWSYPNRFEEQIKLMEQKQLDGCGTWSVHVDLEGDIIGYETFPEDASGASNSGYMYPLRHPSGLFKRSLLDDLGGFDNDTRFGADAEYLFRAFLKFKLENVQQFLYEHTIRPASLTQNAETGFQSNARKSFNEKLIVEMEGILAAARQPPEPGFLLDGRPAGCAVLPGYEVLHLSEGNQTWQGK